ncbi:hypothetical protein AB0L63_03625 [Nocardia sp. NPDC051990]|uniref:hypothetical protein n=1 Tax=Nocardia sp. NPDC051990 TaxID=3155285 RepID=UPI0034188BFD
MNRADRTATPVRVISAWLDPAAWDGETEAGGVRVPAVVMASVALDEIVVRT